MSKPRAPRRRNCSRRPTPETLPDDLFDYYTNEPEPRRGPTPKDDTRIWRVVDDWPERVPITEAEIEVFERWFADIFDELFGPS